MEKSLNILFLSISSLPHLSEHCISNDLLHEFCKRGHRVSVICAKDTSDTTPTVIKTENGCHIVRINIGENKKASLIKKGITTVLLPLHYINAIKEHYKDEHFDLILYPTPPVTVEKVVRFVKKRDNAETYLLLKDIFPQNAVDLGVMKKTGLKSLVYRYFRNIEKNLYSISDRIGCMSRANVDYVLNHNPEIKTDKVEVCPNSIEVQNICLSNDEKLMVRKKYSIPTDKKVFVYGGNLGKPQGIPFIIECLRAEKNNDEIFFFIVGDGTEYRKLEAFVNEEKPENVLLMKSLPKKDYDQIVAACDVGLIFLDHRFTIPNFPSRLLSYMQAGLPVLACTDSNTDIGNVITEGGFGWWCESDDVESFSLAIKRALHFNASEMGKNALVYLNTQYTSKQSASIILKEK